MEEKYIENPFASWQIKLGIALFILSIAVPVIGLPLVASVGLSTANAATVSGLMLMAGEVLGIVAIAIMGKDGYAIIKSRVLGFIKRYGPPSAVSRARYTVGLVMFCLPILFGWLIPYTVNRVPGYQGNEMVFAVVGDFVFLSSLFVLGGDFWDKVRSLFVYDAKAILPDKTVE